MGQWTLSFVRRIHRNVYINAKVQLTVEALTK